MAFGIAGREVEQDDVVGGEAEIDRDQLAEGEHQKSGEEQHSHAEANFGRPASSGAYPAGMLRAAGFKGFARRDRRRAQRRDHTEQKCREQAQGDGEGDSSGARADVEPDRELRSSEMDDDGRHHEGGKQESKRAGRGAGDHQVRHVGTGDQEKERADQGEDRGGGGTWRRNSESRPVEISRRRSGASVTCRSCDARI